MEIVQYDLRIQEVGGDLVLCQNDCCHEEGISSVMISKSQIDGVIETLTKWRDGQWPE